MSNAISQSATQLAVSGNGEESYDFLLAATNASLRQAKGTTRERAMLNRPKLISAVCADYRSHFVSLYGKTERLPTAIFEHIEKTVDKLIESNLKQVGTHNVIGLRRAFFHNSTEMEVTERVQITGENKITLKEQHLGIVLFIGATEKHLRELENKPTPDYEREKAIKQQLMKLNVTKSFIEGEIAHQEKLATEASKINTDSK